MAFGRVAEPRSAAERGTPCGLPIRDTADCQSAPPLPATSNRTRWPTQDCCRAALPVKPAHAEPGKTRGTGHAKTWAEFKKQWHRYTGKESSAYQEHFNDLCRMLGHPTPVEADPSGEDFFCFQKGVLEDLELLDPARGGEPKKGFADVWKKDGSG